MPYIEDTPIGTLTKRHALSPVGKVFPASNEGDLNFQITELCKEYLRCKGRNYATINSIVGVLECAKLEFYRRIAVPYEDTKIQENGDVY